jgi:hypothetical protein
MLLLVGRAGTVGAEFFESGGDESHEKSPEMVILRFPGLRELGVESFLVVSFFSVSPLTGSGEERPRWVASLAKEFSEFKLSFENLEASFEDRLVLGETAGDGKGLNTDSCWSNAVGTVVAEDVSETLSVAVVVRDDCTS